MSAGTIAEVLAGTATWCVEQADCDDVLPVMADRSVDVLLTDPPYGLNEAAGKNRSRSNIATAVDYGDADWDAAPPDAGTISQCPRVSSQQVVFGGNYFTLPPARCWLVWDKLNGANDFADCELAWTNLDRAVRRIAHRWAGMLRDGEERGAGGRVHPTQKPVAVMLWALAFTTGAVVLDPFAGSGTSGVAAIRAGRRFIGIERDAAFAAIARERLAAEERGLTLRDVRAGQSSLFDAVSQ